jgi:hypothetical protein
LMQRLSAAGDGQQLGCDSSVEAQFEDAAA